MAKCKFCNDRRSINMPVMTEAPTYHGEGAGNTEPSTASSSIATFVCSHCSAGIPASAILVAKAVTDMDHRMTDANYIEAKKRDAAMALVDFLMKDGAIEFKTTSSAYGSDRLDAALRAYEPMRPWATMTASLSVVPKDLDGSLAERSRADVTRFAQLAVVVRLERLLEQLADRPGEGCAVYLIKSHIKEIEIAMGRTEG